MYILEHVVKTHYELITSFNRKGSTVGSSYVVATIPLTLQNTVEDIAL